MKLGNFNLVSETQNFSSHLNFSSPQKQILLLQIRKSSSSTSFYNKILLKLIQIRYCSSTTLLKVFKKTKNQHYIYTWERSVLIPEVQDGNYHICHTCCTETAWWKIPTAWPAPQSIPGNSVPSDALSDGSHLNTEQHPQSPCLSSPQATPTQSSSNSPFLSAAPDHHFSSLTGSLWMKPSHSSLHNTNSRQEQP